MGKPLVSVIVAAYNVEAYLNECLDSILVQDYDNFELIVVDDASTDDTALILNRYKQKDRRVHVIHHPRNSGPSAVRNTGIDFAKGKYILFVDGDDLIANNLLSETVACAEKYELDEVSFGYKVFAEEREWSWKERNMEKPVEISNSILTGRQMLIMREKMKKEANGTMASLSPWAWLYNKEFLSENNLRFFEGIVHEDFLFWFQCCLRSKRVMMLGKQLYFYRKNSGSITTGWNKTRAKSFFAVISLIYADWVKNDFSLEENEAISTFLRSVIGEFRKAELRGETDDVAVNPAIDFGYKLLHGELPYRFGHLTSEKLEYLSKKESVLVYGAGSAAADVFEQLNRNHIKIMGVIVSNRKGNPSYFGGVPVKTMEEWGGMEDMPVILAITGKYCGDIESTLKQYGYHQVIKVEER